MGCLLSHLSIWTKILQEKEDLADVETESDEEMQDTFGYNNNTKENPPTNKNVKYYASYQNIELN